MKIFKLVFTATILLLSLLACKEELVYDVVEKNAPIITSFTPSQGRLGELITIDGEYLHEVDTVSIGSGGATIKYRINSTQMIVEVSSESTSGPILVGNVTGEAVSESSFTVLYPTPGIKAHTNKAKAYDKILIEGDDMDVVTAVYFGDNEGEITTQQEDLVEVLVPFFKDGVVDINLAYPTATGTATVTSTISQFELDIVPPTVTNCPDNAPDSTEITISGDDLYSVDSVLFGGFKGTIIDQGDTSLTVLVPKFSVTATVELSLYYFGNKLVAHDAFQVQVATLAYWNGMNIYSDMKDGAATTDSTFFDAVFGNLYSPCEWDTKKDEVHFFITINNGKIRITAQDASSGSQITKFSCGGTALPAEKTPNTMRLKRLNPADADEKGLIDDVKNQTLEELNSAVLEELGIGNASQSYLEEDHFLFSFSEGDVVLFQQYNEALTEVQYTGAMEVVSLIKSNGDTEAVMQFNAYFGAY